MTRVLLMRPLEDALPMAKTLRAKGIEISHHPIFQLHFLPLPLLKNPQALIITSKNAIRALLQQPFDSTHSVSFPRRRESIEYLFCSNRLLDPRLRGDDNFNRQLDSVRVVEQYDELKKIPLYVVGDKTAELAKQTGFLNVSSASGTSQELIQLMIKTAQRDKGMLWHLSGEKVKGNIVESLETAGFEAKRQIVYSIEDAMDLPPSLDDELKNQTISHVIFCSPRTTTVFVNLLKKKKLEKMTCQMICLCLSQDIGEKALSLKWKKLWISPRPNMNDLMGYFDEEK